MFDQPVRSVMNSPVVSCCPQTPVSDANRQLVDRQISSMAVVTDGRIAGVVTRADLLERGARDTASRGAVVDPPRDTVASVMTEPAIVVGEDETLNVAARAMVAAHIHRVYVVRGATLVGVVSTRDVMDAISQVRAEKPISELATSPVHSVTTETPIRGAIEQLKNTGVTGLIVTENEHPVGMFSRTEALGARGMDLDSPLDEAMDAAVICLPETTLVHRAARQATTMGVRRIVTVRSRKMHGVITGLDFARFAATPDAHA